MKKKDLQILNRKIDSQNVQYISDKSEVKVSSKTGQ